MTTTKGGEVSDVDDLSREQLIERITELEAALSAHEDERRRTREQLQLSQEELQVQGEALAAEELRLDREFKTLTRAHTDILNLLDSVTDGLI